VQVLPWITLGIDGVIIMLLLFAKPIGAGTRLTGRRLLTFASTGAAVGLGLLLFALPRGESVAVAEEPAADNSLIEAAAKAIEDNYGRIETAQFQMTVTVKDSSVTKEETIVTKRPDGTGSVLYRTPQFTLSHKFLIRGTDVRRETEKAGPAAAGIYVQTKSRAVKYLPEKQRAWLTPSLVSEADPFDPRCSGFDSKVTSVAAWLREATIKGVKSAKLENGKKGLEVDALEGGKTRVHVVLAVDLNYLPARVTYFRDDGSLMTTAEVEYEYYDKVNAWFPKRYVSKFYRPGAAQSPNSDKWQRQADAVVKSPVVVNAPLPDATFNPILAAGTLVTGVSRAIWLEAPTPAFSLKDVPRKKSHTRSRPFEMKHWLVVLAVDAALLAVCVLARRRLP
jgi:hypothetical protein